MTRPIKFSKSRLLVNFNALVREFLKNCEECEWTIHEVVEYTDRWQLQKDRLEIYCNQNGIEPEELQIHAVTSAFVDYFEGCIVEFGSCNTVEFDLDEEDIEELEECILDDFDDEASDLPSFFDEDDTEDYDFEDDDDDDDDDDDED